MIFTKTLNNKMVVLFFYRLSKMWDSIFEKNKINELKILGFNSFIIADFLLLFFS